MQICCQLTLSLNGISLCFKQPITSVAIDTSQKQSILQRYAVFKCLGRMGGREVAVRKRLRDFETFYFPEQFPSLLLLLLCLILHFFPLFFHRLTYRSMPCAFDPYEYHMN